MEHAVRNDDTLQRSRTRNGTRSIRVSGSPPRAYSKPELSAFLLVSPHSTSVSTHTHTRRVPPQRFAGKTSLTLTPPRTNAQNERHRHDRYRRKHWWMRDHNPTDPETPVRPLTRTVTNPSARCSSSFSFLSPHGKLNHAHCAALHYLG